MGSIGVGRSGGNGVDFSTTQEDFVTSSSSPALEEAYRNYKSIRISKNMPKAEQARRRKLKAQYKAEMERLRKQSR